ncbi:MAG TPA: FtsX-like permease family protein, partial [Gemmatimonadales bacterium]|nr:FtsX-like permease family protein [Gemmatimonadales bacterium]
PEIAIRRAVGASRVQVLLAQLLEGGILAWCMWLLAIAAAIAVLGWHTSSWPGRVTTPSLAFMLPALLALLLVIVAVLVPFSYSSARFLVHPPEGRAGLEIPTFQLALSLAVLITGAMLLRQGQHVDAGHVDSRLGHSVVVHLDSGISDPALRAQRYQALLDRVRSAPGVDSATLSGDGELLGLGTEEFTMSDCGICPRSGILLPVLTFHASYRVVSAGALPSRDRLEQGRFFSDADKWDTARVVLVNHHLAQRYFQNGKPLGRDIYLGANSQRHPYTVVGVVADQPSPAIGGRLQPREVVYLPVSQHPPERVELVVGTVGGRFDGSAARREGRPLAGPAFYRQLIRDTLGDHARITSISTASAILGQEAAAIRWFARRFGFIGLVIFLVAVVGTFDTMRMWLRGLSHELAIRRAVGATRRTIAWWVLVRAAGAGIAGTALGVFLYLSVMMPAVTQLMNDVPVWDGRVVVTSVAMLVAAMMAGAAVPLVRMLREPVARGLG